LVLEEVAPGGTVTVRDSDNHAPDSSASGVETADASSGANRLLWRVQPAELDKTVLVKGQAKPAGLNEPPPLNERGHP
jgi:hypothetical protein